MAFHFTQGRFFITGKLQCQAHYPELGMRLTFTRQMDTISSLKVVRYLTIQDAPRGRHSDLPSPCDGQVFEDKKAAFNSVLLPARNVVLLQEHNTHQRLRKQAEVGLPRSDSAEVKSCRCNPICSALKHFESGSKLGCRKCQWGKQDRFRASMLVSCFVDFKVL